MATVLDALIVTVGLDTTKFSRGSQQVSQDLKNTEGRATATAKVISRSGEAMAAGFRKFRNELIAVAGVLTAGLGIKSFTQNSITTTAEIGRLSTRLNLSVETITKWQGAAERMGGTAEGMAGSFSALSQGIQNYALMGDTHLIPFFNALQVSFTKANGEAREMPDILLDIAKSVEHMPKPRANAILSGMGIFDQGTINMILQGEAAMRRYLADQEKIGFLSKRDAEAAQAMQSAWRAIRQSIETTGTKILTALSPSIMVVLEGVGKLLQNIGPDLRSAIESGAKRFDAWASSANWKQIEGYFHDFIKWLTDPSWVATGSAIGEMVKSVGTLATDFHEIMKSVQAIYGYIKTLNEMTPSDALKAAWDWVTGSNTPKKPDGTPETGEKEGPTMWPGVRRPSLRNLWNEHVPKALRLGDMPAVPYEPKSLTGAMNITPAQYDAFKGGVANLERARYDEMGGASKRFAGRYQMGEAERASSAKRLGEPTPTQAQFLADPAMQERYFEAYTLAHHEYLMKNSPKYQGMGAEERLAVLGYAHNQGEGGRDPRYPQVMGAKGWLETGEVGQDGNNTRGTAYYEEVKARLAKLAKAGNAPATPVTAGANAAPSTKPVAPVAAPPAPPQPVIPPVSLTPDLSLEKGTTPLQLAPWVPRGLGTGTPDLGVGPQTSNTITIDNVNITTSSDTVRGVAGDFSDELQRRFRSTVQFDTGLT